MGFPMFILNKKLQILKSKLRTWNRETFGNIQDKVQEATNKQAHIQTLIQNDGALDSSLREEKNAHIEVEKALKIEEALWQEK